SKGPAAAAPANRLSPARSSPLLPQLRQRPTSNGEHVQRWSLPVQIQSTLESLLQPHLAHHLHQVPAPRKFRSPVRPFPTAQAASNCSSGSLAATIPEPIP